MAVHGKVKAVGAASMGEMELEKLGYFLNGRANETPVSISTAASGQTACATLRRLFASDSSQAISTIRFSLGGAAAYDAIFEKNICHGVSGNPAQKKIVMLGGHLDHYLHGERLLRKGVKEQGDRAVAVRGARGGFGFDSARNQGRKVRCQAPTA